MFCKVLPEAFYSQTAVTVDITFVIPKNKQTETEKQADININSCQLSDDI